LRSAQGRPLLGRCSTHDEASEPLARSLAQVALDAGSLGAVVEPQRSLAAPLIVPVHLSGMERLLKRVAWGGDGKRGVARIEFAAGALSGATLQIEANQGSLSLLLELPPGASSGEWVGRLRHRLRARGLRIDEFIVR
jgi:hypothetical protein